MEAITCINLENNHNPINNTITKPIDILKKNDSNAVSNEQYSLNLNNFNPSKMTPPNYWKSRLESRLKHHSSV